MIRFSFIARATSAIIFFETHDLEEAIYLGERVILAVAIDLLGHS